MTVPDPWLVLGLAPGSSLLAARAARRRLAKQLHPDLHGEALAARMSLVNEALAEIETIWGKGPADAAVTAAVPPGGGGNGPGRGPASSRQSAHASGPTAADPDSFSVDCLPAEAFEALFLAGYGLGDILVADEPYLLEVYLTEPAPCFCRLTLAPEAGASLVTAEVSAASESAEAPGTAAVIGVLIHELNALAGS